MSALDLTASAVSRLTDVAESAMTDEGCRTERSSETRYLARTAVLALAPLIERQVREQVARDIEAQADRFKASALSVGRGSLNEYDTGALDAAAIAARIARGES